MNFPSDDYRFVTCIPFSFPAIRVIGRQLTSTTIYLDIYCSPAGAGSTVALQRQQEQASEGLKRLTFWFEAILSNSVLIDINTDTFAGLAETVENTILFSPALPTDTLLIELLHAKICAITKGFLKIHSLSFKADDTNGIETSFRSTDGYDLPDISYFPKKILHKVPWWDRDTIEVCEFLKGDILEENLYNRFSDFFEEDESREQADIIVFTPDDENGN